MNFPFNLAICRFQPFIFGGVLVLMFCMFFFWKRIPPTESYPLCSQVWRDAKWTWMGRPVPIAQDGYIQGISWMSLSRWPNKIWPQAWIISLIPDDSCPFRMKLPSKSKMVHIQWAISRYGFMKLELHKKQIIVRMVRDTQVESLAIFHAKGPFLGDVWGVDSILSIFRQKTEHPDGTQKCHPLSMTALGLSW